MASHVSPFQHAHAAPLQQQSYDSDSSAASGSDPLKTAAKAELDRRYPLPPLRPSEEELAELSDKEKAAKEQLFKSVYKQIIHIRNKEKPAIVERLRHELRQKELQQRQQPPSPFQAQYGQYGYAPPSQQHPFPGQYYYPSPSQMPNRARGVTPSPEGTPMPACTLDFGGGTGETPQRTRNEAFMKSLFESMLENNNKQSSENAKTMLEANDNARKDTQDKNNAAFQTGLDDTHKKNNAALKAQLTSNKQGIQELDDNHKKHNMEALQRVLAMAQQESHTPAESSPFGGSGLFHQPGAEDTNATPSTNTLKSPVQSQPSSGDSKPPAKPSVGEHTIDTKHGTPLVHTNPQAQNPFVADGKHPQGGIHTKTDKHPQSDMRTKADKRFQVQNPFDVHPQSDIRTMTDAHPQAQNTKTDKHPQGGSPIAADGAHPKPKIRLPPTPIPRPRRPSPSLTAVRIRMLPRPPASNFTVRVRIARLQTMTRPRRITTPARASPRRIPKFRDAQVPTSVRIPKAAILRHWHGSNPNFL